MFLSPKELDRILEKNPSVKVHEVKKVPTTFKQTADPKYWNVKVYVYADGFACEQDNAPGHGKIVAQFDSRKEYQRFIVLQMLQRCKLITDLRRQQTLVIHDSFKYHGKVVRAISYRADFSYKDLEHDGVQVIEDVKGFNEKTGRYQRTEAFNLKWKLLMAKYPEYDFRIY